MGIRSQGTKGERARRAAGPGQDRAGRRGKGSWSQGLRRDEGRIAPSQQCEVPTDHPSCCSRQLSCCCGDRGLDHLPIPVPWLGTRNASESNRKNRKETKNPGQQSHCCLDGYKSWSNGHRAVTDAESFVPWAIYYARMKACKTCGDLPRGTPTSQVGVWQWNSP